MSPLVHEQGDDQLRGGWCDRRVRAASERAWRGAERLWRANWDDENAAVSTTAVRRTEKRKATSEVATYSSDCAGACVPCGGSRPGVRRGDGHAAAFLTPAAKAYAATQANDSSNAAWRSSPSSARSAASDQRSAGAAAAGRTQPSRGAAHGAALAAPALGCGATAGTGPMPGPAAARKRTWEAQKSLARLFGTRPG